MHCEAMSIGGWRAASRFYLSCAILVGGSVVRLVFVKSKRSFVHGEARLENSQMAEP